MAGLPGQPALVAIDQRDRAVCRTGGCSDCGRWRCRAFALRSAGRRRYRLLSLRRHRPLAPSCPGRRGHRQRSGSRRGFRQCGGCLCPRWAGALARLNWRLSWRRDRRRGRSRLPGRASLGCGLGTGRGWRALAGRIRQSRWRDHEQGFRGGRRRCTDCRLADSGGLGFRSCALAGQRLLGDDDWLRQGLRAGLGWLGGRPLFQRGQCLRGRWRDVCRLACR